MLELPGEEEEDSQGSGDEERGGDGASGHGGKRKDGGKDDVGYGKVQGEDREKGKKEGDNKKL